MKKIIIIMACLLMAGHFAFSNAQDYTRQGKQYSAVKKLDKKEVNTGFTWKDSKGNVYDIYITDNNACYIKKISAKTGNEYRQYMTKEISAEIAKEMGRQNKTEKK